MNLSNLERCPPHVQCPKQDLSIGSNLKALRKAAGLTQAQAAAQLQVRGLPVTAEILSKMEQGRYSVRISVLQG